MENNTQGFWCIVTYAAQTPFYYAVLNECRADKSKSIDLKEVILKQVSLNYNLLVSMLATNVIRTPQRHI